MNIIELKKFLFGLIRVDMWYQQNQYDAERDDLIEYILANEIHPDVEYYLTTFGDKRIFTANYPFAYGNLWGVNAKDKDKLRPSRYNIYRLHKYLKGFSKKTNLDAPQKVSWIEFHTNREFDTDFTLKEIEFALRETYPEKFI